MGKKSVKVATKQFRTMRKYSIASSKPEVSIDSKLSPSRHSIKLRVSQDLQSKLDVLETFEEDDEVG